jgi:predicted amino acid racemase
MGRKKSGFHGFRRYRVNHLRNERVTEVLLRIWVGHARHGITHRYTVDALKRDVKLRRDTAEQVGLGFHMPNVEAKLPVAPTALKLHPDEFAAGA